MKFIAFASMYLFVVACGGPGEDATSDDALRAPVLDAKLESTKPDLRIELLNDPCTRTPTSWPGVVRVRVTNIGWSTARITHTRITIARNRADLVTPELAPGASVELVHWNSTTPPFQFSAEADEYGYIGEVSETNNFLDAWCVW